MMVHLITTSPGEEIGNEKSKTLNYYFLKIATIRDMCYLPLSIIKLALDADTRTEAREHF